MIFQLIKSQAQFILHTTPVALRRAFNSQITVLYTSLTERVSLANIIVHLVVHATQPLTYTNHNRLQHTCMLCCYFDALSLVVATEHKRRITVIMEEYN